MLCHNTRIIMDLYLSIVAFLTISLGTDPGEPCPLKHRIQIPYFVP